MHSSPCSHRGGTRFLPSSSFDHDSFDSIGSNTLVPVPVPGSILPGAAASLSSASGSCHVAGTVAAVFAADPPSPPAELDPAWSLTPVMLLLLLLLLLFLALSAVVFGLKNPIRLLWPLAEEEEEGSLDKVVVALVFFCGRLVEEDAADGVRLRPALDDCFIGEGAEDGGGPGCDSDGSAAVWLCSGVALGGNESSLVDVGDCSLGRDEEEEGFGTAAAGFLKNMSLMFRRRSSLRPPYEACGPVVI